MATLVIKKQLLAQFRRRKLLVLAILILVIAVGAFKVCKKFKHLHRELRDLKNQEYVSDSRFEAYKQIMDRKLFYLESKLSERVNHQPPPDQKMNELSESMRNQKLELSKVMQRNDLLQFQVQGLSDSVMQYRREKDALQREMQDISRKYEHMLSFFLQKEAEQDFKSSIEKKLTELANTDYEHQQTFKDVKKAIDSCANKASLQALEAYIDDKLVGSTSTNSHPQESQATPSEFKKLGRDQKLIDQRVTILENKQQEDELIKNKIVEASTLYDSLLQGVGLNKGDIEEYLQTYLKNLEKDFSSERHSEQKRRREQWGFTRHHQYEKRNKQMEPPKIYEKVSLENQRRTDFMNYNKYGSKTPEELIQLMDQLLAQK